MQDTVSLFQNEKQIKWKNKPTLLIESVKRNSTLICMVTAVDWSLKDFQSFVN